MSLPAITFVSEKIQDKKLEKTIIYRYFPTSSMKEDILNHLKEHLKCDLDEYSIELEINVNMKRYTSDPIPKKYWYEDDNIKPKDDTKNS